VNISVIDANGGWPTASRAALTDGRKSFSIELSMSGRSARSRSLPTEPDAGLRPGPNGGTSREGTGSG
jgi:hypothetical protein